MTEDFEEFESRVKGGDIYREARAQLVALVGDTASLGKRGDLSQAVQVRFTGVAFFNGVHQRRPRGGGH